MNAIPRGSRTAVALVVIGIRAGGVWFYRTWNCTCDKVSGKNSKPSP